MPLYPGREKQLRDLVVAREAHVAQLESNHPLLHTFNVVQFAGESKSSQPKCRPISTPDGMVYGTDSDSSIRNNPVVSDTTLVTA